MSLIDFFPSNRSFKKLQLNHKNSNSMPHLQRKQPNLKEYDLTSKMSSYKLADNGTRTRTNRAEVCYATPTTSYPQNHVIMMTVTFYNKTEYKIKRILYYFIPFLEKWLFIISIQHLKLYFQHNKYQNFTNYYQHFQNHKKSHF